MQCASFYLSKFLKYIYIRYRSKQCTLELSVMATVLVFTTILFPANESFLWNENLYTFHRYLIYILLKFDTGFFSCCFDPFG